LNGIPADKYRGISLIFLIYVVNLKCCDLWQEVCSFDSQLTAVNWLKIKIENSLKELWKLNKDFKKMQPMLEKVQADLCVIETSSTSLFLLKY
jgi:hypothetical protein